MDSYLPQIVKYLQDKEPPSRICAQLKLCSNQAQAEIVKRAAQQSPCVICQMVVQMVESYIQQNATEQQILTKLESVCERLPSPYSQEVALYFRSCGSLMFASATCSLPRTCQRLFPGL